MEGLKSGFEAFLRSIKRGERPSSLNLVMTTASYLHQVATIHETKTYEQLKQLISIISSFGKKISINLPMEIPLVNIVRRVLHIIREECEARNIQVSSWAIIRGATTLTSLLKGKKYEEPSNEKIEDLMNAVLIAINELIEELETHHAHIAEQAAEHIHANEVILTFGHSKTVELFLKEAHQDRKFEVLVAEQAPQLKGHTMAKALASSGISTTLIPDTHIYALMSRVNKVIIGIHALMANGGLISYSGSLGVCLAAQAHSVPVLVACGLYKLSPLYPFDQDTFNDLLSPALVTDLPDTNEDLLCASVPAFDYVPPELISLYITNLGGHHPFYLYRLRSEYYSQEDYDLTSAN
jgi:translation initiation factor eIF-2B subunit beta